MWGGGDKEKRAHFDFFYFVYLASNAQNICIIMQSSASPSNSVHLMKCCGLWVETPSDSGSVLSVLICYTSHLLFLSMCTNTKDRHSCVILFKKYPNLKGKHKYFLHLLCSLGIWKLNSGGILFWCECLTV